MKKLLFTTLSVGLLAASANAAVTLNVVDGCYQIGTVEELYGFADVVNGGESNACGKLTKDITVNTGVLNSGMTGLKNGTPANAWTPMDNFIGIFDGDNHTISGLYCTAASDAGFIKTVEGGTALIKNLKIRDSYIGADDRAGGFIADVKNTGKAFIDGSSYIGFITTNTAENGLSGNIAELVGTVSGELILTNSYVEGEVHPLTKWTLLGTVGSAYKLGGLVGFVQNGANVTINNCYSTANVTNQVYLLNDKNNILVGSNEGTISADNIGCKSTAVLGLGQNCADVVQTGVVIKQTEADTKAVINTYDQSKIVAVYSADADVLGKMLVLDPSYVPMTGVSISYDNGLVATITDASETFSIPQDIKVSKVVFNRVLKNNTSSTMALPFDIATGKLSGAAFYEPTAIVARANDDERDTINVQPVNEVVAYKSYVVIPDAEGSLVVDGAVVLKKTSGADLNNNFSADWQFINPIEMKRWDIVGSTKYPEGNNADEIGRVYGFAGANTTGAELGSFVRVATNVAIKPMRGYLMYTGELPEGCKNALCKSSAAVQMPESIVLRIVEPVVPSDEEQVTLEEGTTALQGMRQVPMAKTDRWFDLKGRSLNKKPASKGVFINNRKPVIVK